MVSNSDKKNIHSLLIGEHPSKDNFIGEWLSYEDINAEEDRNDKIHRKLVENEGTREEATSMLSNWIIQHHINEDQLSRLEKRKQILSKYEFEEVLKSQSTLPTLETTKNGNATEILLAEYLQATNSPLEILLYRLRYNPNVNQSMKGDDVILFNKGNLTEKVIVGEAKFRALPSKKVVLESSTLDWTTPMREVTVKSMKVGDFIMTRTRRTFTPEFKLQMVRLFENGKSKAEIDGSMISQLQL